VGVGFSVPSNLAKAVTGQIQQYGSTRRGSMGLKVRSVDQAVAEAYGLKKAEGAIITGVDKGGPAETAGLKIGDLITAFNNQPVKESRDLSRIISVSEVGAKVAVRYLRSGRAGAATITLAAAAPKADEKKAAEEKAVDDLSNILGVQFRAIQDSDRRRNRIPRSVQGVIVDSVDGGSDALGKLRVGAVITEVNFTPVSTPEQALAAAEAAAALKKPVLLQVWGDGEVTFVSVKTKK
jgi:serine protease Do